VACGRTSLLLARTRALICVFGSSSKACSTKAGAGRSTGWQMIWVCRMRCHTMCSCAAYLVLLFSCGHAAELHVTLLGLCCCLFVAAVIRIQRRMHEVSVCMQVSVYAGWCGARQVVCRLLVHCSACLRSDSNSAASCA
jgi:hypothetical protein